MKMTFSKREIASMIDFALKNGGAPIMIAEEATVGEVHVTAKSTSVEVLSPNESPLEEQEEEESSFPIRQRTEPSETSHRFTIVDSQKVATTEDQKVASQEPSLEEELARELHRHQSDQSSRSRDQGSNLGDMVECANCGKEFRKLKGAQKYCKRPQCMEDRKRSATGGR